MTGLEYVVLKNTIQTVSPADITYLAITQIRLITSLTKRAIWLVTAVAKRVNAILGVFT